ncbi:CheY-like chemotaxis protein [Bradyrhizobium japonicum USDA 38]|nr:CheY-like chemotaxis protein [Bradyrhizobium japonicum USDA 38]
MTATGPSGRSVFLVEDEVMIRMMVADMLEELGYKVAAEAGDITEALRLAQATEFDIAILDVNVNGKVISPVADVIRAKGCPFIFPATAPPACPSSTATGRRCRSRSSSTRSARPSKPPFAAASDYFSVALSASENASLVRSSRSGVTET